MCKLINLLQKCDIPASDKSHFYQQFGSTVKELLKIKDFYVFLQVLTAFIEWATNTELTDLNFMVPDD